MAEDPRPLQSGLADSCLFGAVYAADDSTPDELIAVAREFSPRIAIEFPRHTESARVATREIVMDLSGLTRLFGDRHAIAAELRRTAAERGLRVRLALADTRTAARLLVHHRAGVTVIDTGGTATALAALPVEALRVLDGGDDRGSESAELVRTLRRWGVRTLAAFAALPPDDLAARLGQSALRWQRVAAGDDLEPLVPSVPEERFEQALDLEWPIEGLEPLSFVLSRLLEPLSHHLERRDRGAAVLHVRLHLVTRVVHERSLQLPVPMREARTLRTLLLLDLESHPPSAAIDRVVVAVDPTPGRVVQYSLLTRPLPTPEQLSTLMARLQALMGESRCGAPAVVDSWRPGAFAMRPFAPRDTDSNVGRGLSPGGPHPSDLDRDDSRGPSPESRLPRLALRRYRLPVSARVAVESGRPASVTLDRRGMSGGRVARCAGPWRTSGGWWTDRHTETSDAWDRDEWDVTLADRITYRMFRERDSNKWFVEGVVD